MDEQNLRFSIRFYDKQVYTTDPDKPILIQIGLRNLGNSPIWFSMPDQAVFQVAFHVMSAGRTGLYLPNSEKFNENRFNNQPVFFRDVTIAPDEEYNYVINLRDFVDLDKSGIFTVNAEFHPALLPEFQGSAKKQSLLHQVTQDDPAAPSETVLASNTLTLSVRPALPESQLTAYDQNMDKDKAEYLKRENKSPDEVVTYLLESRQDSKEARFFLYLDLEDLYKRSPQYRRTFLDASAEEQEKILESFKNDIWKREDTLAKIPSAFEILSTSYTAKEATVTARLKFDAGDYLELREYKYALKKSNGYWVIYDYQVRNLSSERKHL